MENSHGTGPATPRSPARPASEKEEPIGFQSPVPVFRPAENEPIRGGSPFIPLEPIEDDDSERIAIEATFKYRLIGLRRLPRYQRALALGAAREWRQIALKELRERRARERNARYMLWQMRLPPPIQPH
jgi:hypothetical protein